jgi:phosphoribosylformylglycinamidine synthase
MAMHLWLFSETAGRVLASVQPVHLPALRALAASEGVPVAFLGTTGGDALSLGGAAEIPVAALREAYETTLPRAMQAAPDRGPARGPDDGFPVAGRVT